MIMKVTQNGGGGHVYPPRVARRLLRAQLRRALGNAVSVVEALQLIAASRRQRGGLLIRCPAHAPDVHPSCSVRTTTEGVLVFKCFACGARGDVFNLIALARGIDAEKDFQAVLAVARDLALTIGAKADDYGGETFARPAIDDAAFAAIAELILARCPLDSSASVVAYLQNRRLLEEARADGWGALPDDAAAVEALVDEICAEFGAVIWRASGMTTPEGMLAHPRHSLLIPWRDAEGRVSTLQRRICAPFGGPRYLFPTGRAAAFPYGSDRCGRIPVVAIVEGAFDVLAMRRLCRSSDVERAILGVAGVSAWNTSWAATTRGRDVLIGLDADAAGDQGASAIARDCMRAGAKSVRRIIPATGKDWSAMLEETEG